MSAQCDQIMSDLDGGIAASLTAVDCVATEFAGAAFSRLFAPGGALGPVLTIVLTLFVAIFAIMLLTGRSSVGVRSLTPRAMTLGLVLTFATSWVAYQSVVWNLALGAPDYLATILTGSDGSATAVFASKIDVVFQAVQEATRGKQDIDTFSPAGMMWMGAMLFLLGTVGVLVTARIALAVLVALGPIFVVMALFNGTRGLFAGWVKGMVMLAAAPLIAVLGGSIMLELAVPILSSLLQGGGELNAQAAMAFFMVGAVHVALMIITLKVAGTMVAGWEVFGLAAGKDASPAPAPRAAPAPAANPGAVAVDRARAIAPAAAAASVAGSRRIDVSAVPVAAAANDAGGTTHSTRREVKVLATSSGGVQQPSAIGSLSRAHGIGSRFRAPNRPTEKLT